MCHEKSHDEKINIHVFGFITANAEGGIEKFTENLDATLLKQILQKKKKVLLHIFPHCMWFFLWDNDKKHTAKLVKDWLHNNGITQIDYPPYSGDINIIENVWNKMKYRVELRNPKSEDELKAAWEIEWEKTDKSFIIRLAHSMPARCQAIIDAEGDHIPFMIESKADHANCI